MPRSPPDPLARIIMLHKVALILLSLLFQEEEVQVHVSKLESLRFVNRHFLDFLELTHERHEFKKKMSYKICKLNQAFGEL